MKSKVWKTFACLLLIGALGITGCSNIAQSSESSGALAEGNKDVSENESETGGAQKVLNFGIFNSIETLEPTTNWDSWYVVRMGVGETLVKFGSDMSSEPWLAQEWSMGKDQLTWTFKIREGIKFSSGTQLTAQAVMNSIHRVFELNPDRATTEFFELDSMSAEGMELIIKTKSPTPNLPGFLADPLFLIVDTTGDTESFAESGPICTGPYVVTAKGEDKIETSKNENYWEGVAPLDKANYILIADTNTRAMALQSGEIQMAANMAVSDLSLFADSEQYAIEEISSLRVVMAYMNMNRILEDEELRKAVVTALDLETYAQSQLSGEFEAGVGPLPSCIGYGYDELNNEYTYNVEDAKKILQDAGYTDSDGDGTIEKNGEPVVLDYLYYSSRAELPLLAEATQISLAEIGIQVNLNQVEYANLTELREAGEFDLCSINVITAGTGDPQSFMCGYFQTDAANNSGGYSNTEADALLDALKVEFDLDKREELIKKVQQSLLDHPGYIFYAYPKTNIVHNAKVTGVEMYPADYYWVTKDTDIEN